MKLTIQGKEIDLGAALPLRVGDWRALQKAGVNAQQMADGGIEHAALLAEHVLKKAGADVQVDNLSLDELGAIVNAVGSSEAKEKEDRPT